MPLTEQQHKARLQGLGGSDMAPVIAWYADLPELSPWKQAQELWLEKTGQLDIEGEMNDEEINQLYFGHVLEDPIAQAYSTRTGQKVRRVNRTIKDSQFDFMIANIDRAIEGEPNGGVEIKNVGSFAARPWGKDGTDEVAPYYLPQVHHYITVRDAQWWDVAAYFGGGDFRIYRVERSEQWCTLVQEAATAFWSLVQAREAPGWNWEHPTTAELLKTIYGVESGKEIELDTQAFHWHKVMQEANQKVKEYEAVAAGARNHLLELIGDAALALLPDGTGYKRTATKVKACTIDRAGYTMRKLTHVKNPKRSG